MNPKVRVIVEFMKSNIHRELTVDELCAVAGLSHSRLHRVVKAEVGMSPMHFTKCCGCRRPATSWSIHFGRSSESGLRLAIASTAISFEISKLSSG